MAEGSGTKWWIFFHFHSWWKLKLCLLLLLKNQRNSVCAKSLQSCLFCDSMDCSPPGSSLHWILWAKILGCVTMPSSRGSPQPRDWTWVSCSLLDWQVYSWPLVPPGKPKELSGQPNMMMHCCFSFIFNIKIAIQKFTNFGDKIFFSFLMHADMTAVTMLSKKKKMFWIMLEKTKHY